MYKETDIDKEDKEKEGKEVVRKKERIKKATMSAEGNTWWLPGYMERYLTTSQQLQKLFASNCVKGFSGLLNLKLFNL